MVWPLLRFLPLRLPSFDEVGGGWSFVLTNFNLNETHSGPKIRIGLSVSDRFVVLCTWSVLFNWKSHQLVFDFVASTTSTAIGMMFHKSPFQYVMGMVATNGKIWMHFSREREKLDGDMYRTWLDALTCDILHLHTYKPGQTPTFDSLSYEFVTELNLVALQSLGKSPKICYTRRMLRVAQVKWRNSFMHQCWTHWMDPHNIAQVENKYWKIQRGILWFIFSFWLMNTDWTEYRLWIEVVSFSFSSLILINAIKILIHYLAR